MPLYQAYPKKADTPSRKSRKGSRTKTFLINKEAARKIRKARKAARDSAREAAEQAAYEETVGE